MTLTRQQNVFLAALLLVSGLIYFRPMSPTFPEKWNIGLRQPADDLQHWVIANRKDHPIFVYFFEPLQNILDQALREIEEKLLSLPAITFIVGLFLITANTIRIQTAFLSSGCLLLMGIFGLWEKSMATLSLILLSVFISLLIGIPLGIWMAFNKWVRNTVQPILDAMQTLPTFVYLIPAILFFGVGGVPSLVATVIYALPPVARLTYLGIRQVPAETIEAARAFGSTRRQMLYKVQLPLALPSIMAGVNQTIMMALSMVVIAALIGAGGLGRDVLFALRRLRVGDAFEAGLAIVAMAIALDRLTYGFSRVEARTSRNRLVKYLTRFSDSIYRRIFSPSILPFVRPYLYWCLSGTFLLILTVIVSQQGIKGFPEKWRWSISEPIDEAVVWAQINLYEIEGTPFGTGPFSDFIILNLLLPLKSILQEDLSWVGLIILTSAAGYSLSGWRLAYLTALGLFFIGLLGMWEEAMDTLSQVMVAVFFAVAIGIPIGIFSARYKMLERILRPLLDTLQTIPTFVYLVPMIMLFNLGRVPGVLASVLYALPPVIRLTTLGIHQVDKTVVEAGRSFGSSSFQLLYKIQLPLALPSIMIGINQTVMMVLAMVVVAGLVGGDGLGFEVVSAVSQNELGRGLESGLAIVALAIVLDRLTQARSTKKLALRGQL